MRAEIQPCGAFFLDKKKFLPYVLCKGRHKVSTGITMNVCTKTIAMQNSEACFGSSLLCALLCDRLSGLLLGADES
jgi:hypothetical protein